MKRKLINSLAQMTSALALAGVLALAACGGEDGGEVLSPTPGEETPAVQPEELDAMMLQAADLPEGFSYELSSDVLPAAGLEEPKQRVAGRHLRSLLEQSLQAEGKMVCIVSDLELYESAEAAAARLTEERQVLEEMATAVPPEEGVPEKLELPALGDEAWGFFLSAPRVSFCGWEAAQAEVVSLTFRKGDLLADVRTYTLGQGASTDQAVELARKLLGHIEAALNEQ
ncbi:MAG: hypothetical protein ACUVV3_05355 [Dehalococcoidia bacterium]